MATIVNDADVQLQATSPRLVTITMPTNTQVDFAAVTGATKPSNNADVTTTILTASGTSIVMTNSQLFKSSSGVGGVFIGSGGLIGKDGSGNVTFSINATTGAAFYAGDINTAGKGIFKGSSLAGSVNYAVVANLASAGGANVGGVYGESDVNFGVAGVSTASGGWGVYGSAQNAGGVGVTADSPGVGLWILNGTFKFGSFNYSVPPNTGHKWMRDDGTWSVLGALASGASTGTAVLTSKPGTNSNSVFIAIDINGTIYDFVAFPR